MHYSDILKGVFAPITTPFDENEHIQMVRLAENIEKYNQTCLKGYMPLGSNGEYMGLTDDESLHILREVYRRKAQGKIVVAGCGRESAYKTVEFIKQAVDCGLDMAFVLPPNYYTDKMSEDALKLFYTAIADKSPVPIVIYNAPKFASNILITESLMQALSFHPNIAAMKNSSMYSNAGYVRMIGKNTDFCIIAGNIKSFFPGLCDGAVGGVLSTASYLPEYCCELYKRFINNDLECASKLHKFLNELSSATISPYGVAGVKTGLDIRGFYGGCTRNPLLPIPEPEKIRIAEVFSKMNIQAFPVSNIDSNSISESNAF